MVVGDIWSYEEIYGRMRRYMVVGDMWSYEEIYGRRRYMVV